MAQCKQQLDLEVETDFDGEIRLQCPGCHAIMIVPTELPTVMFLIQAARQFKHTD